MCSFRLHHRHHITLALSATGVYDFQFAEDSVKKKQKTKQQFNCYSLIPQTFPSNVVFPLFAVSLRLMSAQTPASWGGSWLPTAWVRWLLPLFLDCGLTTGLDESRWSAPSSSISQQTSTMHTPTCPPKTTRSTCSCPELLWALEQVSHQAWTLSV